MWVFVLFCFLIIVGLMVYLCPWNLPWGRFMAKLGNNISLDWLCSCFSSYCITWGTMSQLHKVKISCFTVVSCFLNKLILSSSHRATSQHQQTTNIHFIYRETPQEWKVLILWLDISVCQHQCLPPQLLFWCHSADELKEKSLLHVISKAVLSVEEWKVLTYKAFILWIIPYLHNPLNPNQFSVHTFSCSCLRWVCSLTRVDLRVHCSSEVESVQVWNNVGTALWLWSQKGDSYMNRSRKQRSHREKRESESPLTPPQSSL